MLSQFGISQDLLCSFCSLEEEIPTHILYSCNHTQILWERLLKVLYAKQLRPSISDIMECHSWLH